MTLLAQQEMLEPSPTRRVIVPHGCDSWYGVDPSTKRVSIAWVDGAGRRGVATMPFPGTDGAQRLSDIYALTRQLVRELTPIARPGLVLVEQPSGSSQQVNLPLIFAVGVIQTAIFDGIRESCGYAVRLESVTSSWWKARACGKGNIYKPKRGDDKPYGVLVWARENGYDGHVWDEADAWGLAEAGRRDVALEPR